MASGYTNMYQQYTSSEVLEMLEDMEEPIMEGSDDDLEIDLEDNLLER